MIDALGLFEIALLGGTACLSWMATGIVLHYLRRNAILDHPNERSSHKVPTPRGGGWGIMLTLLPTMALIGWIVDRFDHVLPAFVPPHASVPVLEGRLMLGTWQRICLVDTNTDNHQRQVRFSFLAG